MEYQPIIIESLQSTVRTNPKIDKVYFDHEGRHYFNVYKLRKDAKDTTPEKDWLLYGTGLFSHQQLIPGIHNVDKKKESISKGDDTTTIIKLENGEFFMTRAEILASDIKRAGTSHAVEIANSSDEEKALMLASILPKDIMDLLRGIQSGKLKVVQSNEDKDEDKII